MKEFKVTVEMQSAFIPLFAESISTLVLLEYSKAGIKPDKEQFTNACMTKTEKLFKQWGIPDVTARRIETLNENDYAILRSKINLLLLAAISKFPKLMKKYQAYADAVKSGMDHDLYKESEIAKEVAKVVLSKENFEALTEFMQLGI